MAVYSPSLATPTLTESCTQLAEQLDLLARYWGTYSEADLTEYPGPGRWSRKEILGHLIDSALNNYRRIVLAQLGPPPHRLRPYDQDAWVRIGDYQHLPSAELLTLWTSQNRLILHVLNRLPAELLDHEYLTVNGNPTTLHWLIADYVLHLEHHVRQIIHY
ncbi:DinB family protein [Hymenobacter ruber]